MSSSTVMLTVASLSIVIHNISIIYHSRLAFILTDVGPVCYTFLSGASHFKLIICFVISKDQYNTYFCLSYPRPGFVCASIVGTGEIIKFFIATSYKM